jgi:hypothetical protein
MIRNRIGSSAFLLFLTVAILSGAVSAQGKKVELSGSIGYTTSSGFDVEPVTISPGVVVDSLAPKSGFSWGFQGDYNVTPNIGVGFLFSRQSGKLLAGVRGGGEQEITEMPIYNYHGVFTYNIGEEDSTVRPFVFGGLGATQYSPDSFSITRPGSVTTVDLGGLTKFSTTWGGGVKIFPSKSFGFKLGARWTPTYITSDPDGIWCTPFYCYVVGDSKFSHQFEFSGGVVVRF